MARELVFAFVFIASVAPACDEPTATIEIKEIRGSRDAAGHVIADTDIVGHDSLGRGIGTYCLLVTFPGEAQSSSCNDDLRDGDRKTLRAVSQGSPDPGASISIAVRLGAIDAMGSLAAPPR
jgi:hypothetical protein